MIKQRGLALIMVLMIFAIASVIAIAMVERQNTDRQRSATMFTVQQARQYVIGGEDAVKTGLYLSWQQDKEKVHLYQEWAKERRFPLQPGMIYLRITDAQGRFNLNTLAPNANNRARQLLRFTHLLNLLGIDPVIAQQTANWMNPEGQADDLYQGKEPPYRAAYQGCQHSSELMLVDGMNWVIYQRLEPYIACLPISVMLNINTASPLVLASLSDALTLAQGESIAQARGEKGFSSVDEFLALPEIKPLTEQDPNKKDQIRFEAGDFSVKSDYFEAFIRADLNERIASSETLIYRDSGSGAMMTVYRDFSRREARQVPRVAGQASPTPNSEE